MLKVFVDASNYRAILLSRNQERAVRNVDKLLVDALAGTARGSSRSVGEPDDVRPCAMCPPARERAVAHERCAQLMSIHQAKRVWNSLIVVLGDVCKTTSCALGDALVDLTWASSCRLPA